MICHISLQKVLLHFKKDNRFINTSPFLKIPHVLYSFVLLFSKKKAHNFMCCKHRSSYFNHPLNFTFCHENNRMDWGEYEC